jgi:hypothetical protein
MEKSGAGKSTVGYILAAFEKLRIAVRETRFEARKNGAQTSSIKRIRVPVFSGTPEEIAAAKALFAAEYDAAYAWARSPKDTPSHEVVGGDTTQSDIPHSTLCGTPPTTQGGTLESSCEPSCEPSSSSSLPPPPIEDEEEGVVSAEVIPHDPFSEIPEEGLDGLTKEQIVAGVERLVSENAGDEDPYRARLLEEILSGEGRTLRNILRQLSPNRGRPRLGSNRRIPALPAGIEVFDLYAALPGRLPGGEA